MAGVPWDGLPHIRLEVPDSPRGKGMRVIYVGTDGAESDVSGGVSKVELGLGHDEWTIAHVQFLCRVVDPVPKLCAWCERRDAEAGDVLCPECQGAKYAGMDRDEAREMALNANPAPPRDGTPT